MDVDVRPNKPGTLVCVVDFEDWAGGAIRSGWKFVRSRANEGVIGDSASHGCDRISAYMMPDFAKNNAHNSILPSKVGLILAVCGLWKLAPL